MIGMRLNWQAAVSLVVLISTGIGNASSEPAATPLPTLWRVNAPYFSDGISFAETAIFWFGQVTPSANYTDVRVGYTATKLWVHLEVFDRRLWYDPSPAAGELTAWDSVTLLLNMNGASGGVPTAGTFRLDAQLSDWEYPRANWQTAYRGNGSGWSTAAIPFTTESFYRWEGVTIGGINNNQNNRGYALTFHIPFASLGLSGPPAQGSMWGLAVINHDRDEQNQLFVTDKVWPDNLNTLQPASWGQLRFGLPAYTAPASVPQASVKIRQGLNGAAVIDSMVGGGFNCGNDLSDRFLQWGDQNYAHSDKFNVQNQYDVADWPCYSKAFITFPLNLVPAGKTIVSATLTLFQMGNAGGGVWGDPLPSYIQVLTVGEEWSEGALTWNNAPRARENVTGTWVSPLDAYPGYPGVAHNWDIARAVAEAYTAGEPLRLAIYSADDAMHSGRYFYSSDLEEYGAAGRPTLTIMWGDRTASVQAAARPVTAQYGHLVTYTITIVGSGRSITLTDNLPAAVSVPGPLQVVGGGSASYRSAAHQVVWQGTAGAGQSITLTFPVTVLVAMPQSVVNTVLLTDAIGASTASAVFIANAHEVYLPVLRKQAP